MSIQRIRNYELRITNLLSSAGVPVYIALWVILSVVEGCACAKRAAFALFVCWGMMFLLFSGCDSPYPPKPKGFFRINLPEKSYREFTSDVCPFRFQYPVYADIVRDSLFFDKAPENPCWLNIDFKELGGKIHLSYKEINAENSLEKLIEDAHKLTFKHTTKADFIDENIIENGKGASGILFAVGGNAASNAQFFLTDSLHHFIRGSLYFNSTPNEDSLAPVIRFVKEDMLLLMESFEWVETLNIGIKMD